jgi:hypothetical protein
MAAHQWLPRWTGAVCAVAGCMPMLAAFLGGLAGAAGAQGSGMAMGMMAASPTPPAAWITDLGHLSLPLLVVSAALLLWSFYRTEPRARAVAYAGVVLLIVNQISMTLWLFLPAMVLLAIAFALARAGSGVPARGLAGRPS